MSFESKFERFLTELHNSSYEVPNELNPYFKSALITAGFNQMQVNAIAEGNQNPSVAQKKPRKLTGYNVFMKDKMLELKENNIPSSDRMTKVSTMWKSLDDSEKVIWKNKAENLNGNLITNNNQATSSKKNGNPSKLTGYQQFLKDKMPEVKNDPLILPKERMSKIASMWKLLPEIEKNVYNGKRELVADSQSDQNAPTDDDSVVETGLEEHDVVETGEEDHDD